MEKFGARAEWRDVLQEKMRGRGGSSCRFERIYFIFCGRCNTGGTPSGWACFMVSPFPSIVEEVLFLRGRGTIACSPRAHLKAEHSELYNNKHLHIVSETSNPIVNLHRQVVRPVPISHDRIQGIQLSANWAQILTVAPIGQTNYLDLPF